MNTIAAVKLIHITCVILSISGFTLRAWWKFSDSPRLQQRLQQRGAKTLPHIIDTFLLVSALTLLKLHQLSVFEQPWLQAKIIVLLAYITFGLLFFRKAKTKNQQLVFFVLAVSCFAYIVGVAMTKSFFF